MGFIPTGKFYTAMKNQAILIEKKCGHFEIIRLNGGRQTQRLTTGILSFVDPGFYIIT